MADESRKVPRKAASSAKNSPRTGSSEGRLTEGDFARLAGTLQSQKQLGGDAYPPTVAWLLNLAGMPDSTASALTKDRRAKKWLLLTSKENAKPAEAEAALAVLPQDFDDVASSPRLLLSGLKGRTNDKTQLFTLADLAKFFNGRTETALKLAWKPLVATGILPPGVGSLKKGGTVSLFLLESVVGLDYDPSSAQGRPCAGLPRDDSLPAFPEPERTKPSTVVNLPQPAEPTATASEASPEAEPTPGGVQLADGSLRVEPSLGERILRAFDDINFEGGRSNYVTLAALRRAFPDVPREQLDVAIAQLRRERTVSLDSADGRHERLSEEEIAAAIVEEGCRLVYMARIQG